MCQSQSCPKKNETNDIVEVIRTYPAEAGMYAKLDDNTYALVVMWAHVHVGTQNGRPDESEEIWGLTLPDVVAPHHYWHRHLNLTTERPRNTHTVVR